MATGPHEQKLQLAGSHCSVPGGRMHVLHGLGRVIFGSITMKRVHCSYRAEESPRASWHYVEASSQIPIEHRKLMELKWVVWT